MKNETAIVALRRKNLRRLVDEAKQKGLASSDAAFAEMYALKGGPSFLSQLMNGHGSFGDKVARRIEEELSLEKWHLDKEQIGANLNNNDESASKENLIAFDNSVSPKPNDIHISPIQFKSSFESKNTVKIPVHKNVKASCGAGVENFLEEITGYVEIDPEFLRMLGVKAKPEKLRLIYSDEWSMWPTVVPDTPLFVDITPVDTSAMISGDVYVFLHNAILRMKRVFVSYGDEKTVRLQSDNPDKKKFPDEIITKEQLNELSFVGRLELALVKP